MRQSPLRLIERRLEHLSIESIDALPKGLRGIYALFEAKANRIFNVVYVGMSDANIRRRLRSHRRRKANLWTHCSVFTVWDNIREEEIRELEGILRHIYRHDAKANSLNAMKSFRAMKRTTIIKLANKRRQATV
ncbi:MAG: GIY-YIG nuclease family protein [Planctomycetota bacterium]